VGDDSESFIVVTYVQEYAVIVAHRNGEVIWTELCEIRLELEPEDVCFNHRLINIYARDLCEFVCKPLGLQMILLKLLLPVFQALQPSLGQDSSLSEIPTEQLSQYQSVLHVLT
jgi:hypothetical protein